jgi:hypothetical protein
MLLYERLHNEGELLHAVLELEEDDVDDWGSADTVLQRSESRRPLRQEIFDSILNSVQKKVDGR